MTFTVRDVNGTPMTCPAAPVTMTVTPWFAPPTGLPEGTAFDATRAVLPDSPQIERAIDHVAGWTGFLDGGRPVACGRSALRAVLRSAPHVFTQLENEIDAATAAGVLS